MEMNSESKDIIISSNSKKSMENQSVWSAKDWFVRGFCCFNVSRQEDPVTL